jgi:hypothetical protein
MQQQWLPAVVKRQKLAAAAAAAAQCSADGYASGDAALLPFAEMTNLEAAAAATIDEGFGAAATAAAAATGGGSSSNSRQGTDGVADRVLAELCNGQLVKLQQDVDCSRSKVTQIRQLVAAPCSDSNNVMTAFRHELARRGGIITWPARMQHLQCSSRGVEAAQYEAAMLLLTYSCSYGAWSFA